jgi:hypothetical protein
MLVFPAFLVRPRTVLIRKHCQERWDQELEAHLEMLADDCIRAGETRGEAFRRARLAFGGVLRTKEAVLEWC